MKLSKVHFSFVVAKVKFTIGISIRFTDDSFSILKYNSIERISPVAIFTKNVNKILLFDYIKKEGY